MPKTSKELSREAQVLKAFSLQSEGMSLTESCKEAGIAKRTYQRWSESVLGKVEYELAEIKAQMAAQAVGAWPLAVAEVIGIATGESTDERPTSPRDRLAAFDRLQSMVEEIKGQSVPEDESAAGYLGSTPHWLQGPKTVTVEMGDGGKVTVETGSTPEVIEGRAETL
jgi:hypothetical protein